MPTTYPTIDAAITALPGGTFTLRAFPARRFRVSPHSGAHFMTPDGPQIVIQSESPTGEWLDFSRGTVAELRAAIAYSDECPQCSRIGNGPACTAHQPPAPAQTTTTIYYVQMSTNGGAWRDLYDCASIASAAETIADCQRDDRANAEKNAARRPSRRREQPVNAYRVIERTTTIAERVIPASPEPAPAPCPYGCEQFADVDSKCHACAEPEEAAADARACLGHQTTVGPIGQTVYCDGSCRTPRHQATPAPRRHSDRVARHLKRHANANADAMHLIAEGATQAPTDEPMSPARRARIARRRAQLAAALGAYRAARRASQQATRAWHAAPGDMDAFNAWKHATARETNAAIDAAYAATELDYIAGNYD